MDIKYSEEYVMDQGISPLCGELVGSHKLSQERGTNMCLKYSRASKQRNMLKAPVSRLGVGTNQSHHTNSPVNEG